MNDLGLQHAEQRTLPLSVIDPPPDNPRRDFDEDDLSGLAASIERVGLLEPVIVRPKGSRYELVAGERRLRACNRIGTETIPAVIRELDDLESAEIRLLENLDRRDLNPVEEADGFRRLRELGHTDETLAELIRRTVGEVQGRLGLLRLPTLWQDRVRRGELPAPAAEYLVDFAGHPEILNWMDAAFKNDWPMPLGSWKARLTDSVLSISRTMDPEAPDGPLFEVKVGQRKALDVVTVRHPNGKREARAMNCELWDRLQDKAETAAAAVMPDEPVDQVAPVDDLPPVDEQVREPAPAARITPAPRPSAGELAEAAASEYAATWIRNVLREFVDTTEPATLWQWAESLELNPAGRWRLDRDFLESYSRDALRELAAELRVDISAARSDGEVVAILSHAARDHMPASVRLAFALVDEEGDE